MPIYDPPAPDAAASGPLAVLTREDVRRWGALTRAALAERRREIDALNVFPVPDGDTGTNLYLTFEGALDTTHDTVTEDMTTGQMVMRLGHDMLWSARGNSGVIFSQFVRGFAESIAHLREIDGPALAAALASAASAGRTAVEVPVEGTILTVGDAAARGAAQAGPDATLSEICRAAAEAARDALARTPEMLPALAAAEVVDAGGAGLVLTLEALDGIASGEPERLGIARGRRGEKWRRAMPPTSGAHGASGPAYEVMYLLEDVDEHAVDALRQRLASMGDSLLIVGDPSLWRVHVHVDDAGGAIEAAVDCGRPRQIRVNHLHSVGAPDPVVQSHHRPHEHETALVAAAAGEGLRALFEAAGAQVLMSGPGSRASTRDFVIALRTACARGQRQAVVLPNDADTLLCAQAAARAVRDEGVEVAVVSVRAAVQGIAALAVFDPNVPVADNSLAMQAAASATRHGAVTVASKRALTTAGMCEPGDVLGIVDNDVVVIGSSLEEVAGRVTELLVSGGSELLTILVGADAPEGLADIVTQVACRSTIGLEVETIAGEQPNYPLLLGAE